MSQVKLTKSELRDQQKRLDQLQQYLPTLQLKKAMLQIEVNQATGQLQEMQKLLHQEKKEVEEFRFLFSEKIACNLEELAHVAHVERAYENIAGVEIPIFEGISFQIDEYSLFDTPIWTDAATEKVRSLVSLREKINIMREKIRALAHELREVSIRVNLFEKILIPRALENIKKIKIFLNDQQLAEIGRAKVAKAKILLKKARRP